MIKKILVKKEKKQIVNKKERLIEKEKIYFIEDISKDYHCSDGLFKKEDLKKVGIIKSSKEKEFYIIDASFIDSYKQIRKTAQTIPLKDLGFILAETGIDKNSIVIDAGSGSGGAACFFARYVKKVYSFDINEKNIEQSKKNAEYFGLENIEFRQIDVYKEIPVKGADMILLDLPEPWNAIRTAIMAIKSGGFIVAYCPQITQAQKFINNSYNLLHIKVVEVIERDWHISGLITRPKSLSNIHSGFLVLSRKII